MILTSAELVVLGLLIEEPRHGYALDRTIAERGIRRWADLAFSSIYYLLAKLERRGLIRVATTGGPKSRRVYSATDEGKTTAVAAVTDVLRDATPNFSQFVVGLANVNLIGSEQFHACLRERMRALSEQITAVESARETQAPLSHAARLVFAHSLAILVAERDWLITIETGEITS
ncbi:PadR family transcriptional regulator [Alpinimonas psychrophila]|uniref:DNA-binding PadR family transcriptional regulator n=1 Tax=Alpinimonas psychrophila TaxID=748908 RepID=A0A7W3PPY4_9MICO|nr:PadR family transcriptional regulator [Alpinimonas psychrophila]MBA8829728.1 DNA-binding PadR family transcriptional regulator [Alpinimonas psychrophila]